MEILCELNEEILYDSIDEMDETEMKKVLCEENVYLRTMTSVCPTSFLTCC